MSGINYEEVTTVFIMNGFFSEYLPPAFSINGDFDPCNVALSAQPDFIDPLSFTMSRFSDDKKRRTIFLPEFASYLAAAKFMRDKNLIKDLIQISNDPHSFSPIIQINGTVTRHEQVYSYRITTDEVDQEAFRSAYISNIVDKVNRAKGAKAILYLDISNFYQSIYTHLIPSIKLGYEDAERMYKLQKADNTDPCISEDYRTYVQLDQHIRNMNAARTNGLLPGTLISQFVAEALLSRVDKEIENAGIQFVRYVDDYEVFLFQESEIERTKNIIESILNKYFLSLNQEKTKLVPFPFYVVENLEKIYQRYKESEQDDADLMKLFNDFFTLEQNGTKGAIRFLIKSIDDSFRTQDNELFSSYLFNVLANDGRSLIKVCQLLIQRKTEFQWGERELLLLDRLLEQYITSNNHLETIWLLYLRKKMSSRQLPAKLSHSIANSDNDLAKIILLEEYGRKLSDTIIQEIIRSTTTWVLAYQLFFSDYIDKTEFSKLSKIKKNLAFYSTLKRNKFSFYQKKHR